MASYRPYKAYFDELNRLGYIEGQNLIVERYSALGQPDRIGDLRARSSQAVPMLFGRLRSVH